MHVCMSIDISILYVTYIFFPSLFYFFQNLSDAISGYVSKEGTGDSEGYKVVLLPNIFVDVKYFVCYFLICIC